MGVGKRSVLLRTFVSAAAASNVATSLQWLQPLLISYLVLRKGWQPPAAGFLLTAEMGAAALASMIVAGKVQRSGAQVVALWGVALATIGSFVTLYLDRYGFLLGVRVFVGLATGMTAMISNAVATKFTDPARYFGQLGCTNLLCGVLILWAAPHISFLPSSSPYAAIFLTFVVLMPLMFLMPRFSELDRQAKATGSLGTEISWQSIGTPALLLVGVTFIVNVSSGVLWGLYGLIAEQSSIPAGVADAAIAISVGAGAVGAGLAAIIGSSLGRLGPFLASLALMTGSILVLTSHPSATAFRAAVCANVAAIYFIVPYLSGVAVALDPQGKVATYVSSAFFIALAVSPFIGGVMLSAVGVEAIGRIVLLLSSVSALVYVYVARSAAARANEHGVVVHTE